MKKQKKEFLAQFEKDPEKPGEPSPNMILGQTARRPNNSRLMIGNNNIAVIGGAGTGKSRFVIKPNLLTLNSSFVITDPSAEIINSLGKVLNDHGYKIKIFNISDMEHSNCYNPFDYIRDDAGVRMVVECFINNTSNKEGGGEEFWVNAEKLLYSAIIFYLRDYEQDYSKKNFSTLVNMVNMATVDEDNPNSQSELDKIFEKIDQNSLAAQYYRGFKKGAGKTLKEYRYFLYCTFATIYDPTSAAFDSDGPDGIRQTGRSENSTFYYYSTGRQNILLPCIHALFPDV